MTFEYFSDERRSCEGHSGSFRVSLSLGKAMVVESAAGRGKSSLAFGDDLLCDLPFPRASDSGGLGSAELTCQFQLWLIVVRFFQTLPQAGAL